MYEKWGGGGGGGGGGGTVHFRSDIRNVCVCGGGGGQSTSGPIYEKCVWGGQSTSGPIYEKCVCGGGGRGGSPPQVRYTKSGGGGCPLQVRYTKSVGGGGGGQSASGPIPLFGTQKIRYR